MPSGSAAAGRPTVGVGSQLATVDGAHLDGRPDAACPPGAGDPDPSLTGRSGAARPPVISPSPGGLDDHQGGPVGVRSSASPPSGRRGGVAGSQSTVGDVGGGCSGIPRPYRGWEGSSSGAEGAAVSRASDVQSGLGAPRPSSGGSSKARVTYQSRDIREFF